jgi:hypothetical protein
MSAWLENEQLCILTNNQPFTMSIHDLALQGKHNLYNSMAAGIAGRVLDIRKDAVRESFSDFENVEHRLEAVSTVHVLFHQRLQSDQCQFDLVCFREHETTYHLDRRWIKAMTMRCCWNWLKPGEGYCLLRHRQ